MDDLNKSLGAVVPYYPRNIAATFDEFWHAFRDGKLIELMDNHGLRGERRSFPQLEAFFADRSCCHRPVWRLCHFLAFEVSSIDIPSLALKGAQNFGFSPDLGVRTSLELRALYKRLLSNRDPLELDDARSQGRLLDYAKSVMQNVDVGVAKVLRGLG